MVNYTFILNLGFPSNSYDQQEALEAHGLGPGLLGVHRPEDRPKDRPDHRPNDI